MSESTKAIASLKKASNYMKLAMRKNGPRSFKRGQGALIKVIYKAGEGTLSKDDAKKVLGWRGRDVRFVAKKAADNGYLTIDKPKNGFQMTLSDLGREVIKKRLEAEDKAADEKPREVQLDRIKQSGNFLERDFHRAEKQRCQCNKQVTSFHNGISPYCKIGVPWRDGHSGRTPPQHGRLLPPVRTLRPFMRKMKYTHEKHAIKLMIRSAWTALFQRLLTSGLFSFFSGQAAYEGMARV